MKNAANRRDREPATKRTHAPARDTEPAPPGTTPPSQSGYGHAVTKHGSTRPQGGGNPVGPEAPETAGRKGRRR